MDISTLVQEIDKELIRLGEGRWQTPDEVYLRHNIFDREDLIMFALRFLLANLDGAMIEGFDEEE